MHYNKIWIWNKQADNKERCVFFHEQIGNFTWDIIFGKSSFHIEYWRMVLASMAILANWWFVCVIWIKSSGTTDFCIPADEMTLTFFNDQCHHEASLFQRIDEDFEHLYQRLCYIYPLHEICRQIIIPSEDCRPRVWPYPTNIFDTYQIFVHGTLSNQQSYIHVYQRHVLNCFLFCLLLSMID